MDDLQNWTISKEEDEFGFTTLFWGKSFLVPLGVSLLDWDGSFPLAHCELELSLGVNFRVLWLLVNIE